MIRVVTIHSILLVGLFSIVGSRGGVSLVGTQCDALLSIPKKQGASRIVPGLRMGLPTVRDREVMQELCSSSMLNDHHHGYARARWCAVSGLL